LTPADMDIPLDCRYVAVDLSSSGEEEEEDDTRMYVPAFVGLWDGRRDVSSSWEILGRMRRIRNGMDPDVWGWIMHVMTCLCVLGGSWCRAGEDVVATQNWWDHIRSCMWKDSKEK
jgi:hypothetical protein